MPNFDLIVSVSKTSINELIADYHANPPGKDNPFLMTTETTIPGGTKVKVALDINVAPVITFEKPNIDLWNAAQLRDGRTNQEALNPVPALAMMQFQIPTIAMAIAVGAAAPVTGLSNNSIGHITLDFTGDKITTRLVAVTVDKTRFSAIESVIFNASALPAIFDATNNILPVINVPTVDLPGGALNPMKATLIEDNLLISTTLKTNATPLDVTGITMPADPTFVLASKALISYLSYRATNDYRQVPYAKKGSHGSALEYSFSAIVNLDVSLESVIPLVASGAVSARLDLEVFLSDGVVVQLLEKSKACATGFML